MFSPSSNSSHSSTYTADIVGPSKHHQQQRVASTTSHRSTHTFTLDASTFSSHKHQQSSEDRLPAALDVDAPADSRFDSLHELLERAGYKETRIVTPDRQTLAGMFAKKLATPPRQPRLVDDFTSESPSLAASELRRAMQKDRSTPKSSTSKSLPSRKYKLASTQDAPPLPAAPVPFSNWFSNMWLFGPGTILDDPAPSVDASRSSRDADGAVVSQPSEAQTGSSTSSSFTTTSASASSSASTSHSAPLKTKRTASNNPVWSASVAYRSSNSRSNTAPVRKSVAISSDVMSSDAAAEQAWEALQKASSNVGSKKRPGLVDAFVSPTKKEPTADTRGDSQSSPHRQRKWKKERAAWRESLGDLEAMMDQSRKRREASLAAAAATAAPSSASNSVDSDLTRSSPPPSSCAPDPSPSTKVTDDQAITKLLSGPALPFLTTDPAVAPRNGSCTRPTHLSMRRMKSVEVLSKIVRERRTVSSASDSTRSSSNQASVVQADTGSGQISPSIKKRSTPPRLTVSSPRGISSPKELALEGHEFEPISWSPGKYGSVVISNRRVQKKPRSKLRQVSSGSDLRTAAASNEGLTMPKRGRSKIRSSPTKTGKTMAPVAAILRDSMGSLSKGSKIRALRNNGNVFDDAEEGAGEIDDSPTRRRSSRVCGQKPLILARRTCAPVHDNDEEEDVFRPGQRIGGGGGGTLLKKKDFSARVKRTSKIMRLIEEAENMPSIAGMISKPDSITVAARRRPLEKISIQASASQTIVQSKDSTLKEARDELEEGLSRSLSNKSRERMNTITRVLGQRQTAT
nr:putative protein [Melanopsichium pennsylvanicum 4]